MIVIKKGVDLRPYNTFGIKARCDLFCEINSAHDLEELFSTDTFKINRKLILGGGSNILFTGDFKGLVIRNNLKGIQIVKDDGAQVLVKAAAGEIWHNLVQYTIRQGLGGLENLSLIPGCVGASPMQNIGAYGVEIKDVFEELEACAMDTGEKRTFSKADCAFGYRESVFKKSLKDKYLITSVTYRLTRKPVLHTSYGAINSELVAMGVEDPGIGDISEAVIRIRRSKLPDPAQIGNAGSFFKNPEADETKYNALKSEFPELVAFSLGKGKFKLAAGWLIEQCGLKGFEHNGAAVHDRQALVLVNKSGCTGADVLRLSEYVMASVKEKFDVQLEREVNVV